jgi:hypothetical protein
LFDYPESGAGYWTGHGVGAVAGRGGGASVAYLAKRSHQALSKRLDVLNVGDHLGVDGAGGYGNGIGG